MEEFEACCTGGERVLLAYHNIPEESTTIDRFGKRCFQERLSNPKIPGCGRQSWRTRIPGSAGSSVFKVGFSHVMIPWESHMGVSWESWDSHTERLHAHPGKESFLRGDHESALEGYNEAILYSSGKGLAHTLARRAAFLLQTDEHLLALRSKTSNLSHCRYFQGPEGCFGIWLPGNGACGFPARPPQQSPWQFNRHQSGEKVTQVCF